MASTLLSLHHCPPVSRPVCSPSISVLPSSRFQSHSCTFQIRRGRIEPQAAAGAQVRVRCFLKEKLEFSSLLSERKSSGDSSPSSFRFRKNFGLSFPQQRDGKKNGGYNGAGGRFRTVASAAQTRRSFSDKEEGSGNDTITLPIIGKIPWDPEFKITPMKVTVWVTIAAVLYSIWNFISSRTIFDPKFWMYSSWILVVWPLPAATLVGIATLYTAFGCAKRQPKEWEQVLLLVGSLTWLILVPNGLSQGFVDGWPLILFALYVGFFLISAVVRYRMFGDLSSKDTDKQWETLPSRLWQTGFIACVVGGHWLAAFEASFLLDAWNFSWKTQVAIATLVVAVLTHYFATYFLGKYFDRLVRPRAVVMFGPYRVVRHPIYSSYMLLFAGYCLALRSYKSLLFLVTACIVYYEQRTKLEEDMLMGFFGELYASYRKRVANKYFPLIY